MNMGDDLDIIAPSGATTPEGAALVLLQLVADCEGKKFNATGVTNRETVDRAWILETFTECLKAARYER
jgi:hypothetical protein